VVNTDAVPATNPGEDYLRNYLGVPGGNSTNYWDVFHYLYSKAHPKPEEPESREGKGDVEAPTKSDRRLTNRPDREAYEKIRLSPWARGIFGDPAAPQNRGGLRGDRNANPPPGEALYQVPGSRVYERHPVGWNPETGEVDPNVTMLPKSGGSRPANPPVVPIVPGVNDQGPAGDVPVDPRREARRSGYPWMVPPFMRGRGRGRFPGFFPFSGGGYPGDESTANTVPGETGFRGIDPENADIDPNYKPTEEEKKAAESDHDVPNQPTTGRDANAPAGAGDRGGDAARPDAAAGAPVPAAAGGGAASPGGPGPSGTVTAAPAAPSAAAGGAPGGAPAGALPGRMDPAADWLRRIAPQAGGGAGIAGAQNMASPAELAEANRMSAQGMGTAAPSAQSAAAATSAVPAAAPAAAPATRSVGQQAATQAQAALTSNVSNPALATQRAAIRARVDANPALKAKILRIAYNEQGANPAGTQAIIESMINRSIVRGTTIEQEARWHRSEGGYYQEGNMGRGALENPRTRRVLETSYDRAMAGGNVSNYATDNSSGGLARREEATGKFKARAHIHGETFFSPGTAERGHARRWDSWYASVNPSTQVASR
jgi:hypothetical protein